MKRTLMITTAVVAALGISAAAIGAATAGGWRYGGFGPCGGPGGPGMMQGMGGPGTMMFDRFDADRDGTVTRAEFDAGHAALLKSADKDGDGAVSLAEFTAFAEQERAKMQAQRREQRRAWMFGQMDTNKDGTVTADEFAPFATDRFEALDRNDDDVVSADEVRKAGGTFRGWHRGHGYGPFGPRWND